MKLTKKMNVAPVRKILVEIISIIVAILLGFIVNEWREVHKQNKAANLALERILYEMEQNSSHLKLRNKYYKDMIAVMDSLQNIKTDDQISTTSVPGWSGINPPVLNSSSYKTAATVGVFSNIDFTIVDQIAHVYLVQEEINKIASESIKFLVFGEYQNFKIPYALFSVHTQLIESWENSYNQVLRLKQENKRLSKIKLM